MPTLRTCLLAALCLPLSAFSDQILLVAGGGTQDAMDIAATDAVMVARGDLGNELPLEQIPFAEASIIRKAKHAGKDQAIFSPCTPYLVHDAMAA